MQFSGELIEAKLIKRYKRFLADIIFENGYSTTVYCPNPGSLLGLAETNTKIWLEKSKNKKTLVIVLDKLLKDFNRLNQFSEIRPKLFVVTQKHD